MATAQLPLIATPAPMTRAGARSGDGAGEVLAAAGTRDGVAAGAVSFRTSLATALGTDGKAGAPPPAGPVPAGLAAPDAPTGKIDVAPQPDGAMGAGKPRGNGAARTGRAAPADVSDGHGAKVAGSTLIGMVDGGVAIPPPAVPILVGLTAGERPTSGTEYPAAGGGAEKSALVGPRGAGPRGAAPGHAGAELPGLAMTPAVPIREETALLARNFHEPTAALDAAGKAAPESLGGLAAAPAGQPWPEGLAAMSNGAVAGTAPMPAARAPMADAASAAPHPAASSSVYPQIAPALISLAGGAAGIQRLTLRLDPVELGHVQIRIERQRDAPPEVSITADRPETLLLLQRDQHELHRALDQAGIPAEGRQVTFQAASLPDASGQTPSGASPGHSVSAGPYSDGSGHGQARQDGTRPQTGGHDTQNETGGFTPDGSGTAAGRPRWLRAGVDIIA